MQEVGTYVPEGSTDNKEDVCAEQLMLVTQRVETSTFQNS